MKNMQQDVQKGKVSSRQRVGEKGRSYRDMKGGKKGKVIDKHEGWGKERSLTDMKGKERSLTDLKDEERKGHWQTWRVGRKERSLTDMKGWKKVTVIDRLEGLEESNCHLQTIEKFYLNRKIGIAPFIKCHYLSMCNMLDVCSASILCKLLMFTVCVYFFQPVDESAIKEDVGAKKVPKVSQNDPFMESKCSFRLPNCMALLVWQTIWPL